MTAIGWIQIFLFCAIIVALVKPLGWYMTRVFNGERTFLSLLLRPIEIAIYRTSGVDENHARASGAARQILPDGPISLAMRTRGREDQKKGLLVGTLKGDI